MIVLSDEGKELGVEAVIKKLEVWYQKTLSDYKRLLHGGIEIVDEVCNGSGFFKQAHFYDFKNLMILDSMSTSGKPLRAVLQKKI